MIRKVAAPLVVAIIALGATVQIAGAVDEFATPRPAPKSQVPVKTQATLGTRVTEVYVLRAPDVVGQPVGTAHATLERSRLRAGHETTQPTSERAAGTVLGQDPKAGTPVQPGAPVNLVIATPPRVVAAPAPSQKPPIERVPTLPPQHEVESLVAVPDLTGATPQQAAHVLRRYQPGLGQQRERESSAPAGTVIRQAPAPGTRVARESRVNVLIATAPAPVPPPRWTPEPPVVVAPPVVIKPPVVIVPPVIPPIVIQPPAPAVPPIVVQPPVPPVPPVVAVPPAPPAPPVVPEPPLPPEPPAPPVATAPQLPPPPTLPVATAPPAPIVPPAPVVATAPHAPAPVRKPTPKPPAPAVPPAPIPPAPAALAPPAPPIVAQPPAPQPVTPPVRETPKRGWPSPIALGLGSVALLGAAGTVYYRVRTANGTQPMVTPPTITYAAHWDLGTQQIEAVAPLSLGVGLRLQSGVEAVTTTLETHDLVARSHETGGAR